MPKRGKNQNVTETEWQSMPITFGTSVLARLLGSDARYVSNHAEELGGRKLAGKWVFSKTKTAELIGLN